MVSSFPHQYWGQNTQDELSQFSPLLSSTRLWPQTMPPASGGASAVRIKAALVRPETMEDIMRIWNLTELFRRR